MPAGMNGLRARAQMVLAEGPFSGHVLLFRVRRSDRIKVQWWSGDGLCLLGKRGRFVWPQAASGSVALTHCAAADAGRGIDWRRPKRIWRTMSALQTSRSSRKLGPCSAQPICPTISMP